MKKTLSLVLALVLALGVFCAPALAAEYPLVSEPVTVSGLIEKESVGNERILWKELEKLTGKTIDLKTKVDPAVLGGIRLDIEGTELDGTVQNRLAALRRDIASVTL